MSEIPIPPSAPGSEQLGRCDVRKYDHRYNSPEVAELRVLANEAAHG